MVSVGWPRPEVTMLEPSHRNSFNIVVRWYLSITEVAGRCHAAGAEQVHTA